jgi:hypothetical protein
MPDRRTLSLIQPITLSFSKLSSPKNGIQQNNGKRKLEEEVESSTVRKRLWLTDDDASYDDSFDSPEEMTGEEVSSEETLMNDVNTSKEKLQAKRARGIVFNDDGDTTSSSSNPRTPESRRRSVEDSSDDDDLWM